MPVSVIGRVCGGRAKIYRPQILLQPKCWPGVVWERKEVELIVNSTIKFKQILFCNWLMMLHMQFLLYCTGHKVHSKHQSL